MTLQECYLELGGDYEDVLTHMRKEERVRKFLLRFLTDPSFACLCREMENQRYEEAFRAAHTIKGLCQNLGLGGLAISSSALTEALRAGGKPEDDSLFERVKEDYERTVAAIAKLDGEGA